MPLSEERAEETVWPEPGWWKPLIEFAVHITIGTGIFVIVALPAVALDWILKTWLPPLAEKDFLRDGLILMKKCLFGIDMLCFGCYLVNTSWRFIRGMKWKP